MRTAKTPLIASVATVASLGLLGFSAPAYAAPAEDTAPAVTANSTTGDIVTQEMIGENGTTYEVKWDQQTDEIGIYEGSSKIGETTMGEVQAEYAAMPDQGISLGANSCDYAMAGAATANSALWAAAGLTAVAPPAAAVAAGAGLVTTGILTAGSLAAC